MPNEYHDHDDSLVRPLHPTYGRHLEERLNRIELRVNLLFGALGVLVVLGNAGLGIFIALAVAGGGR